MNSKHPPQAPTPEKQKPGPQLGASGEPQSLPADNDLDSPGGLRDPDEKMKRIEREGEINRVAPEPETHTGVNTVGVGQPGAQAVHQGQSLPPAALPVEKKFEGKAEQFYDPMDAERATHKKHSAERGATKTTE
jgi:hypothetical protein